MRGAQLAGALDVPFLEQIGEALVAVLDAFGVGHTLEDFAVLFIGGVANLDLVAQAAQEGFVHQVARGQVGGEDDQHIEGDFDLAAGMQGQEIQAVFKRHDPAVEQVAWADELAAKVVDQQDAAVGFNLEGGFIKFIDIIENQVKPGQGQFTANDNEGPANAQPARVAAYGGRAQGARAGRGGSLFVGELVVDRVV